MHESFALWGDDQLSELSRLNGEPLSATSSEAIHRDVESRDGRRVEPLRLFEERSLRLSLHERAAEGVVREESIEEGDLLPTGSPLSTRDRLSPIDELGW